MTTYPDITLELAEALAAKATAEARLAALGSVRVHWGWGQDESTHEYCCIFGGRLLRSRTLIGLADQIRVEAKLEDPRS